jgi:hypothetical protein
MTSAGRVQVSASRSTAPMRRRELLPIARP